MSERESDLTGIGDLLGAPGLRAWPPEELAEGVQLRRRTIPDSAKELRQATGRKSYVEPVVVDPRPYYMAIALHNFAEGDEKLCPACKGANYVRHSELTPGRPGFGTFQKCPRWRADAKRCIWTKEGDEPWWSK